MKSTALTLAAVLLEVATAVKTNYNFTSQGENISCDLYMPTNATGRVPMAVAGPGFPAVKEMFFPAYGEALSAAGIGLLVFDYVGIGSSGGKTRQDIVISQQQTAYRDALGVAAQHPRVDASRLGVFGKSLSGAHTIYMAATDNRVKAAVAIVPHIRSGFAAVSQHVPFVADIVEDEAARLAGTARTMVKAYGPPGSKAIMNSDGAQEYLSVKSKGTTYRNEATASTLVQIGNYDVASRAKAIQVPILAAVATSDTITPASHVHEALDGLKTAKVVDFPGQHFTMTDPNEGTLVRLTVEHFKREL